MRRFCLILSSMLIAISLTACIDIPVGEFSYSEDSSIYVAGESGVNTDGFKNTKIQKIDSAKDALELAENEVSVTYDTTSVDYDEETKMWRIKFSTEGQAGGDQTVYINSNGITELSVSGE